MSPARLTAIDNYHWGNIRLIATDMDGTLTQSEKFDSNLFKALTRLAASEVSVLIVTGRSAGWVQAIANYLPVLGAISENGGLLYWNQDPHPHLITEINQTQHRQQLSQVFELLKSKFPQIKESADNHFRLTDWTFDVADLNQTELEQLNHICQAEGYGFTYSTVQCHIKPLHQDKAIALNKIRQEYFPQLKPKEIVTIGDSPNDESLFNPEQFPLSVGVANIMSYSDRLQYLPKYITNKFAGEGFCELAELVINHRQNKSCT
ncbi:HAD family hydrolase [Pleurocapsa sp. PCC 7319]|uniref:HAD-IIB family hydrolase n=1 Tax=Pleurocapsa sp. PCC 7319 TaxID=118161 RepID=UPI00034ADFE2|nr:HAD family hydrolase [Pleurocapsa sp. PCC 7319]